LIYSLEIQSCNLFPSFFLLLFAATHWSFPLPSSKVNLIFRYLYIIINVFFICSAAPDSHETKQQKATAIASRLLKELASEQPASHHQEQASNKDASKDSIIPVNHPAAEKVESHIEKQNDDLVDDDDDEDIDFTPTLDDLYEIYGDKYAQLADDGESSSEINDDDYILPISRQQLMRYLDEQEESMLFK
jgi:hypothetical protein